MQIADVEMVRSVRREIARHQIDAAEASVSVMHGVIYLYGRIRPIRGHESELEAELHALHHSLKQRPGIRDVVYEWSIEGKEDGLLKRINFAPKH